jgi:hypothetical protein
MANWIDNELYLTVGDFAPAVRDLPKHVQMAEGFPYAPQEAIYFLMGINN